MATLESAFNPTYSEDASILTGNPNRVTVEVEDTIDKAFWKDLLAELCPQKEFHFDPYRTVLNKDGDAEQRGKGKSHVLKSSAKFNNWHIGCVDSDYDWILSDSTADGKTISHNKYLLQTYAYSIENLMCLPCTLEDFCRENTEEPVAFDFTDYMNRFSETVYPLLVWSAYLYGKGDMGFTPTAWRDILVNTESDSECSLALIKQKTIEKIKELDKAFASEIADKDKFGESLSSEKDITADSAYLYVKGHDLYDHLVNSVLNPIISSLRNNHFTALRSSNMNEDSRNAVLHEYSKKNKSVKELLATNYRYKNQTPLYDKIKEDVSKIWE